MSHFSQKKCTDLQRNPGFLSDGLFGFYSLQSGRN